MDKIDKFLKKLTKAESTLLIKVIADILEQRTGQYDVKKLKGYRDIYRIRVGNKRIIFRQLLDDIEVLDVSLRNEKTYKDY
jgi:mRNA-degrading endonuclease RelE of RelBE toxin-antitoxin system